MTYADEQSGNARRLLAIVGPTAVGKTSLSLRLGRTLDGEIVSADSRLFYQGMDIGTAKPSAADRKAVPHHLIDLCRPDETLTLGEYQRLAYRTIEEILERGKLPILIGGTGQYVMAVIEGWGIPEVAPNPALRAELEKLGGTELSRWLNTLDRGAAMKLDARNVRRLVRALEVTLTLGRPITDVQRKSPPALDIGMIGLDLDRKILYQRIDRRVDYMIAAGLVEEVVGLKEQGYGRDLPAMSGLGYRQIFAYLSGETDLEQAVERVKFETHRYARQQAAWFRKNDPRIRWFDTGAGDWLAEIDAYLRVWLAKGSDPGIPSQDRAG